jgi:hypothetical protein
MGLFDKLSTASGKAFGHIGPAIKKVGLVGQVGGQAVRIAGSIGNGVAGIYNKVNGYTNGALGELLQSVPGGRPALAAGSKALDFYNQKVAPRTDTVSRNIQNIGDKVSAYRL